MRIKFLLIILISLTSCQKKNRSVKAEKEMEYFQNEKFEKALEINKKLIKENPNSYYYYAKRALILEITKNESEAQSYYSKARENFYLKEKSYWEKYDSISMAMMLMEIGDSVRSREILKLSIKNINSNISENELMKMLNQTHGEMLEIVKRGIITESVIQDKN